MAGDVDDRVLNSVVYLQCRRRQWMADTEDRYLFDELLWMNTKVGSPGCNLTSIDRVHLAYCRTGYAIHQFLLVCLPLHTKHI